MVEVSNNLQDFSNSGTLFHYHLVSVMQVQPYFASQLGGDELAILGANFMAPHEREIFCVVGASTPVAARWESSKRVTCELQSTRQVGPVPISVQYANETVHLHASPIQLLLPCHPVEMRVCHLPSVTESTQVDDDTRLYAKATY